jgi:tRNA-dependent cyclodipeptide synthase
MKDYRIIVTPAGAATRVWHESQCVYSVSVGVPDKTVQDLVDGFLWTKAKFDRVAVLLGDSLYALTLQIQRGCSEAEAYAQALNEAEHVVSTLESEVMPLVVFRTSELASNPEFLGIETEIKNAYFSTPAFAGSIEADARAFVRRQKNRNRLALGVPVAESLARHYLVREISVYAYLAAAGWVVDVYLGRELPTLARIMEGSVPAVSPHLARRINISLQPKELR